MITLGFSKVYKVGNVAIQGLNGEEQNKFSKKLPRVGIKNPGHLVIYFDTCKTVIARQVLDTRCLD